MSRAELPLVAQSSHHTQGPVLDFIGLTVEEIERLRQGYFADWWRMRMEVVPPVSSSRDGEETR